MGHRTSTLSFCIASIYMHRFTPHTLEKATRTAVRVGIQADEACFLHMLILDVHCCFMCVVPVEQEAELSCRLQCSLALNVPEYCRAGSCLVCIRKFTSQVSYRPDLSRKVRNHRAWGLRTIYLLNSFKCVTHNGFDGREATSSTYQGCLPEDKRAIPDWFISSMAICILLMLDLPNLKMNRQRPVPGCHGQSCDRVKSAMTRQGRTGQDRAGQGLLHVPP
ncbi:hypothetical protein B0H65DRAFT_86348 [Neurospora tetraspora]|uniref:Uncharacterized protein n=1 Tax=Neurospora tetraspora TaxID=94610 RepID=A0AAE0MTD8_9PEZI|nr:hypothetical protein B0H65DRAFT_86348 [Neurospora tetraspora]